LNINSFRVGSARILLSMFRSVITMRNYMVLS